MVKHTHRKNMPCSCEIAKVSGKKSAKTILGRKSAKLPELTRTGKVLGKRAILTRFFFVSGIINYKSA
jgi:hypothetical protein